ncbi:MAG: hypothetical protein MdMp024_0026 [Bacteroidales bacterium]
MKNFILFVKKHLRVISCFLILLTLLTVLAAFIANHQRLKRQAHAIEAPVPPALHAGDTYEYSCSYDGAWIFFGGYIKIFVNNVPCEQSELYLSFGGIGIGGLGGDNGTLYIYSSYSDFASSVKSFSIISAPGVLSMDFFDKSGYKVGYFAGYGSFGMGLPGGGSVKVKKHC